MSVTLMDREEFRRRIDPLLRRYGEAKGRVGLIDDLPHPEAIAFLPLGRIRKAGEKGGNGEVFHLVQIEILAAPGEWWALLLVAWPGIKKHVIIYRVARRNLHFLLTLAANRRIYLKDTRSPYGTLIEEIPTEVLKSALSVYRILPVGMPP